MAKNQKVTVNITQETYDAFGNSTTGRNNGLAQAVSMATGKSASLRGSEVVLNYRSKNAVIASVPAKALKAYASGQPTSFTISVPTAA